MATTTFTLKIKSIGEVEQITDKFSKIEIIGEELYNEDRENFLKIQGINKVAYVLKDLFEGQVVYFKCSIEGKEWVKDNTTIFFQNLVVKEFNVIEGKHKIEKPKETNPANIKAKDVDTESQFPDMGQDGLPDLNNDDDDLPF